MNQPLHKITGDMKDVALIDDMDPEVIADTLEGLEGDFKAKGTAIVTVTHGMDATIDMIDAEIARLTERKKVIKNRMESAREYLRSNMEASKISKIECPLFNITLAGGRDIATVLNVDELPDDYVTVKTSIAPDKKKILTDLKAGVDIPGARLDKSKTSLRIK